MSLVANKNKSFNTCLMKYTQYKFNFQLKCLQYTQFIKISNVCWNLKENP